MRKALLIVSSLLAFALVCAPGGSRANGGRVTPGIHVTNQQRIASSLNGAVKSGMLGFKNVEVHPSQVSFRDGNHAGLKLFEVM